MTRIDQLGEIVFRQVAGARSADDRLRDRMAGRLAGESTRQRLAPPLQPDLAELRLLHQRGDAGKLHIEGIEREEPVLSGLRNE